MRDGIAELVVQHVASLLLAASSTLSPIDCASCCTRRGIRDDPEMSKVRSRLESMQLLAAEEVSRIDLQAVQHRDLALQSRIRRLRDGALRLSQAVR